MNPFLFVLVAVVACQAADLVEIRKDAAHLRSGPDREWEEFPAASPGSILRQEFQAAPNAAEWALSVRQRDVKNATWKVRINGRNVGALQADERLMRTTLPVPPGLLRAGANILEIAADGGRFSDDIEVDELRLFRRPVRHLLRESTVTVETAVEGSAAPVPVKVTVVDGSGTLVPLAALRDSPLEAVRTGVVYAADGATKLGLPEGDYEVFASRGWEYSAPSRRIRLKAGQSADVRLRLRREVTLEGYASCDTHVHTYELSRHGDADVRERLITAAGEAVDIVVATEHNQTSDYSDAARRMGLDRYLLTIRGNEVTTPIGHFNIFPLAPDAPAPDPRVKDWQSLERSLRNIPGVRTIVQNHPRDEHSGYRPFDPAHHLASAGENLNGRPVFANAMEAINSGAMSSDILRPVRDWLGLLNRGLRVAAIGSSDTHTVDFVPIAQARTYIDVRSLGGGWRDRPEEVFASLAEGENLVAYGLAADLTVASKQPGNLAAEISVHGPSWSAVDRVTVYGNGFAAAERDLAPSRAAGRKFFERIRIPAAGHDVILVAVATGPGVRRPFWEVRKPYQPVSKRWEPRVIGISKAVRVDVDGGGFQSPRDYAERVLRNHAVPGPDLLGELRRYDAAVAIQVLNLLRSQGHTPDRLRALFQQEAYTSFFEEWSASRTPRKP